MRERNNIWCSYHRYGAHLLGHIYGNTICIGGKIWMGIMQHPGRIQQKMQQYPNYLLLWDFCMGEIAVSCSVFAITCKCVLHRWSWGWGEVNCNMMQQATTRSKLRGVLAEMVHIMWACLFCWWRLGDMKSTQQWMQNVGVCRTISGSTSAHEPNPVKYNYITINKYVPGNLAIKLSNISNLEYVLINVTS